MNFPLFIARKLYNAPGEKQRVSRPAIRIAIAGVAIGLIVMIVIVSVVLGFKHTIRDKVVGFGGNIVVADFMSLQSSQQYPVVMNDSMLSVLRKVPGIRHAQRYAVKEGVLKTDSDFLGVAFKGIAEEYDTTFLHDNLIEGSIPRFSSEASHNKLLLSKNIADKLKVKCGDRLFAYFIDKNGVRMRRFTISGIYQTNLKRYDEIFCYTDLYTAVKLNGWMADQASGAELAVNDFEQLDAIADRVLQKVNHTTDHYGETYSSATIKEINPQIFSWLGLMDLNVWVILGLMIAVAAVTMISGLLIIILERTQMIGILKALGARNLTIRRTFLWFAAFIIIKGMLIGDAIAIALLYLQRYTGLVKLDPQTYYVSTVPVEMAWPLFVGLNVATLIICVVVLVVPSLLISHLRPAASMHYE